MSVTQGNYLVGQGSNVLGEKTPQEVREDIGAVTASYVQSAVSGKQDTLTFDSTPTAGSSNPVTSGGIKTAMNGFARIACGSYVGTGTYGSANPCSLTFDFEPKLVIVAPSTVNLYVGTMVAVNPDGIAYCPSSAATSIQSLTWSGNTLSWYVNDVKKNGATSGTYETNEQYQLNGSGKTYYYVAFG